MIAWPQSDLPLLDPLEPRVLPQDAGAWFTINRQTADGGMKQKPYRLHLIEPVLRALGRAADTYMSQGMFAVPTRRAVHVAWLTHGYVDVDCYKSPVWHGETPDDMVQEILWFCADDDIPPPSVILSSGRGIYCKWFWTTPIRRAEAGRAVQVNRVLTRRLQSFRADPDAVDISRILRVRGSINSKNGGQVDIVWLNGPADAPTTYDFHAFARHILPQHATAEPSDGPRLTVRDLRRETWGTRKAWSFSREHWHWGVLEDVRRLVADRYPGGIVREGRRDLYGHVAACQLARVVPAGRLFHEITATARTFLPAGYIDAPEFRRHCSTLLRRATQAAEGELVTFRNGQRTPIYTYSKARLIDLLEITPDEERDMTRLISDAEKRRRETERRRDAGMMERAAWLSDHDIERARPWEAEGIDRATWYRRRARQAAGPI